MKTIADRLKPNVLVVLETAESMQGLPGENPARYNEVGVDCEDGNRSCRLVGQTGRWSYSGMGNRGMSFGSQTASCTATLTNTLTNTVTSTVTNTPTTTQTATYSETHTELGTKTITNTATATTTQTTTPTVTSTNTVTQTTTPTTTSTVTKTSTVTQTTTPTVTNTVTTTSTITQTTTPTTTSTVTNTSTVTQTTTPTVTTTVTNTSTVTNTVPRTVTSTRTNTDTITQTAIKTVTSTHTGTGTVTQTVNQTWIENRTITGTVPGTVTAFVDFLSWTNTASINTRTSTSTRFANYTANTANATNTLTNTRVPTETRIASAVVTGSGTMTGSTTVTVTATQTLTQAGVTTKTYMGTGTRTLLGTGVGTNNLNVTWSWSTATLTQTQTSTSSSTTTGTQTGTQTWTATQTSTTTQTQTGTSTSTATQTSTKTQTHTTTHTTTVSQTSTGTATRTVSQTGTGTQSGTTTHTQTATQTTTASQTQTSTSTQTVTQTGTGTQTATHTQTDTSTSTATEIGTTTETTTLTGTQTTTTTQTATVTTTDTSTATAAVLYDCGSEINVDPAACTGVPPTTSGYCNESGGQICSAHSDCQLVPGDFCRFIATTDGSGRRFVESCVSSAGSPWGSCKRGLVTANTTCSSPSDGSCGAALASDRCAEGQPAKMCADTGIWCRTDSDCPGAAATDRCTGATSRMMTVKRALRRAMTEHADKVNFGFMSTYQGRGIPLTATDASTAIFPYVKLQACPSSNNAKETKLLTRGELERSGCFNLSSGPQSSCTVDYGGDGAINSNAGLNKITYDVVAGASSVWAVPRGDGSGKSNHVQAAWNACASSKILPACELGSAQGTGVYVGTYYEFGYKQGNPVASGPGSMAQPVYFPTYKGKYYTTGSDCYNAIDAERTDIVNDGMYGRAAYTGHPYNSANEVRVPWSGAVAGETCGPTTGALWNANVVPFLTDTTFGGKSISTAEKILMMTARLEKASFGGLHATGETAPIGCALLKSEASPDRVRSAADYLASVCSNDTAANGGLPPCWSNNIILVVDGHSNGPGDLGSGSDCASAACAYHPVDNPDLADCHCQAIRNAYALAHGNPRVQTHVVANVPSAGEWQSTYRYTHAFMVNLAIAGSPGFDGTPSFGTTEAEIYEAISKKIAAAAYPFLFTTTVAVPGASSQNPDTQIVSSSNYLYDTSVHYPSWKGTVRAFDVTSSPQLLWDAATVAANGHPASWRDRRIFFSDKNGNVVRVSIDGSGAVSNAAALYAAGLGASSAEAQSIMRWLLGAPGLGNPAPLMGSSTWSTPIVVGQAGSNGLNGSAPYSRATWKRPALVYVGGDDGMLHAFFAHAGTKQLGGIDYEGGEEAFAFIPNDMLRTITKAYAQRGQKLAADKAAHVFGLAASPKVKDVCIGAGCQNDASGSGWHTILVMGQGSGGNEVFALDITHVIDEPGGLQPDQLALLWSTAPKTASTVGVKLPSTADGASWDQALGETMSVPSFYFAGYNSGAADNRVLVASGYALRSDAGYDKQGISIINADATTGAVKDKRDISAVPVDSCSPRKRALLADIAVARYYTLSNHSVFASQSLMAAYAVDTWGNTYQYVPGATTPLAKLYALGCGQPLYFAPAVVQLDRLPKHDSSSKSFIYLAQVTGSSLDPETSAHSGTFPGSQIVVSKLDGNVTPPVLVTSYNTGFASGRIVLSTDPSTDPQNRICLQRSASLGFTDNLKKGDQDCGQAGGDPLPASARPVGTPTAILRSDGLGFQVITTWQDSSPSTMVNDCSSGKSFVFGKSYITVHEFGADGTWYQLAGVALDNSVLTGVTVVGTGLFVDGINPTSTPGGVTVGETFSKLQQVQNNNAGLQRYMRTTWIERIDL